MSDNLTLSTMRNLLKLIPVVYNFVATCPTFLRIVEDGFSRMMQTCLIMIILVEILLAATVVLALLLDLHY